MILAGSDPAERTKAAWVDRLARKGTKPSDHAPVIADLDTAPDLRRRPDGPAAVQSGQTRRQEGSAAPVTGQVMAKLARTNPALAKAIKPAATQGGRRLRWRGRSASRRRPPWSPALAGAAVDDRPAGRRQRPGADVLARPDRARGVGVRRPDRRRDHRADGPVPAPQRVRTRHRRPGVRRSCLARRCAPDDDVGAARPGLRVPRRGRPHLSRPWAPGFHAPLDGNRLYPAIGQILVHELTHAWQIEHSKSLAAFLSHAAEVQLRNELGERVYDIGSAPVVWSECNRTAGHRRRPLVRRPPLAHQPPAGSCATDATTITNALHRNL